MKDSGLTTSWSDHCHSYVGFNDPPFFSPAMGDPRPPMVIFAGQSHPGLAEEIAGHVGVKLGDILVHNLTSTETEVKLQESIRG